MATEKTEKFVRIIRDVKISLNPTDKWALVTFTDEDGQLTEDAEELIEASPADINIVDGVALFKLSRFIKVAFGDETRVYNLESHEGGDVNLSGTGVANIKLRHADYDWSYKKKSGHTSTLEIIGIRFQTFEPYTGSELSGL